MSCDHAPTTASEHPGNRETYRSTYVQLAILGLLQSIPIWFYGMSLPAVLREQGMSLHLIGLLAMTFLPYSLSFIWAPIFDMVNPLGLGRRRGWLVLILAAMALLNLLSAATPPADNLAGLVAIIFLISFASASLRAATWGYAVAALPCDRHCWATVAIGTGAGMGALAGGTLLLAVFAELGWASTQLISAASLAIGAMIVGRVAEPGSGDEQPSPSRPRLAAPLHLLRKAGVIPLALLSIAAGLGMGATFKMMPPRLVDLGFSLAQIGTLNGVVTCASWVIGGAAAAWIIRRLGLRWGLAVDLALLAGASGLSAANASIGANSPMLIAVEFVGFYIAMSFVLVGTNSAFMATAGRESGSMDVSAFSCLMSFAQMGGAVIAGFLSEEAGYATSFLVSAILALAGICLVPLLRLPRNGHASLTNIDEKGLECDAVPAA